MSQVKLQVFKFQAQVSWVSGQVASHQNSDLSQHVWLLLSSTAWSEHWEGVVEKNKVNWITCVELNGSFWTLDGFSGMADVIGRRGAASGEVTVYKYNTGGVPPLCSLTTFSPPTFTASWFSVSISHPPASAPLYLSAFLPASFCLSLWGTHTHTHTYTHTHGSICLNFSFPVWGVYPIPCSRAQHTSNTFKLRRRDRKEDTQRAYQWWQE